MTSCLLIKAPDRILVVADGRLAVSDTLVRLDSAQKIVAFTPKYQIPRIAMGRFDHFAERTSRDWYVAYAGTYALVSEIIRAFLSKISGGLYLSREGESPVLRYDFDQSGGFTDDYNFGHDELPDLRPYDIAREFTDAAQLKCDEWRRNQALLDCQFLLFGEEEGTRHYTAFKIWPELPDLAPGARVRIRVEEVKNGELATIGSPKVSKAVQDDDALGLGLEGWKSDQSAIGVHNVFADPQLAKMFPDSKPQTPIPEPLPEQNWGLNEVRQRFIEHLRLTSDPGVGGDIVVASGGWYGGISLQTQAT